MSDEIKHIVSLENIYDYVKDNLELVKEEKIRLLKLSSQGYFWLSLSNKKKPAASNIHYEVRKLSSENYFRFEIHFEDKNHSYPYENLEKIIKSNSNYDWFAWSGAKSIRYIKEIVDKNDLLEIIENSYNIFNEALIESYNNRVKKIDTEEINKMSPSEYINLLKARNQIILQGPPGTGKTRVAKIIAINMINDDASNDDKNQIKDDASNDEIKLAFNNLDNAKLIQFHPSYSYEDFVRGISAKTTNSGIEYIVENKILAKMAQDAQNNKKPYVLIIDEINRANLSSVLGELIYALEYRDEAVESMYALKDGSRDITLPSNLYIIGTMNTADRSIGHIDYAIRRRFAFADVLPNKDIVSKNSKFEEVQKLFKNKDGSRASTLSPEFNPDDVMLGHSYFIGKNEKELKEKLEYQVIPLLKEYIKDGVLNESVTAKIKELTIEKSLKDIDTEKSNEN